MKFLFILLNETMCLACLSSCYFSILMLLLLDHILYPFTVLALIAKMDRNPVYSIFLCPLWIYIPLKEKDDSIQLELIQCLGAAFC